MGGAVLFLTAGATMQSGKDVQRLEGCGCFVLAGLWPAASRCV